MTISKHIQLPEVVELLALGKMQRCTYRPMNDGAGGAVNSPPPSPQIFFARTPMQIFMPEISCRK